jgi:hypothetical protein
MIKVMKATAAVAFLLSGTTYALAQAGKSEEPKPQNYVQPTGVPVEKPLAADSGASPGVGTRAMEDKPTGPDGPKPSTKK